MKTINSIRKKIQGKKSELENKYHIKKIGIFGSYSNGTSSRNSDLDILVEFAKVPDFFQFCELERRLSRLLGIKVDLVTKNALKPLLKRKILNGVIFL